MSDGPAALAELLNLSPSSAPTRVRRSKRPRDSQRQRVYTAERRVAFGTTYTTVEECQKRVDQITKSRWWRGRYPHSKRWWRKPEVRPGFGHRRATADRDALVIQLPRWARNDLVICHELAHLVVSDKHPAHGPRYCREFVAIVDRWMGKETGKELRAAFKAGRVKYIQRSA